MNSSLRLGFSYELRRRTCDERFTASESDSILECVKGNLDLSCQFFGTTWHDYWLLTVRDRQSDVFRVSKLRYNLSKIDTFPLLSCLISLKLYNFHVK